MSDTGCGSGQTPEHGGRGFCDRERDFSGAGYVTQERRSQLKPPTVDDGLSFAQRSEAPRQTSDSVIPLAFRLMGLILLRVPVGRRYQLIAGLVWNVIRANVGTRVGRGLKYCGYCFVK